MWPALLPLLGTIFDRVMPDPEKAAAAKLQVMELAQRGELAGLEAETRLALGQIETNKEDAKGASPMQRNWRPAIGWVCAAALAWDTIGRPMLTFGLTMAGHAVPAMPVLSSDQLYGLLFGLLGLGGLRTVEKVKGSA